jgi:hypothetical protein
MSEKKQTTLFQMLKKEASNIQEMHQKGTYETKLVDVQESTSNAFYGGDNDFKNQKGFDILTDSGVRVFYAVNIEYPHRGKIGKFITKYGAPPQTGMKVTVDISGEYEEIQLD